MTEPRAAVLRKTRKEAEAKARAIEAASPLDASLRKTEIAKQLAALLLLRDRWFELEQLGELEKEKSRQLGRITSEIRKHFDELQIEHRGGSKSKQGFLGMHSSGPQPKRK